MAESNDSAGKLVRYARVGDAFTPGAPIDELALFAGRWAQITEVVDAINQRGQHGVLYGERGVGKTSLANILSQVFINHETRKPLWSVKVNCNTTDDYGSVWRNIFREMDRSEDYERQWSESPPDPEDMRYLLQRLEERLLIVIDELDRLEDDLAISQIADTIKTLSDHSVDVTLVLVGVADAIDDLIGDHASVERALTQVRMPRMSQAELIEVLDKGLDRAELSMTDEAKARIARLSEGLPFYTHTLALHAGQRTVVDDRDEISTVDVERAVGDAVGKAKHSITSAYQKAVRSPRKESQFAEVLLACALAPKDELGYFSASAVRQPLSRIMGKNREITAFARNLNKLADASRGRVLQKTGQPRRFFYRFANPLLQPFVILSGLANGLIREDLLTELQDQARGSDDERGTLSMGL
ncbi:MAG: ATP-binding protein [Actinomycetota bacterium]|nr:ATP-binding protein [Actinomycetota bacterium]